MIMKLQITFSNNFQALRFHLFGTLLMLIALYFLNFDRLFLLVFGCVWVLYTIPTLYLHLKYYQLNKGQEFIISNSEFEIKYNKKRESRIFKKDEIEKIVLCRAASMDKGGIPLSSIETYQHIKIFSKNGYVIYITCLMTPNLDAVLTLFQGVRFVREKGILCLFRLF